MKRSKKHVILASGSSAAVLLALCTAAPVASAQAKTTITIANWEGTSTSLTDEHLIAKAYMKLHPDVNIQIDSIPDNYGTKILTEIAAGDAPDIFEIGDGDVSMYAGKGAIVPLDSYLKAGGVNLGDYYKTVLDTGRVNGQIYTMPKDWSDLAIYYNKDMFKKAHIPFPKKGWTWQQLFNDAKKLTMKKDGKTAQWGVVLPGTWDRGVDPILYAWGGGTIGPKGQYVGYMNSKATVDALTFYGKMYQAGVAPSPATVQGFQGVDIFQAKKAAMNMTGIWPLDTYKTTPNFHFGVAPLPRGPKGYGNAICYAGYGIYSGSPNKQAAFDFLKFLTGKQGETIQSNYAFVSMKSVAKATHQTTDPFLKGFLEGVPYIGKLGGSISPYYQATGIVNYDKVLNELLLKPGANLKAELTAAAKLSETQTKKQASQ